MKLKIAILGTKGIPNQYGGFEQFAEYLSFGLARKGHELTVYAPHYHPFKDKEINNVKITRMYCPEKYLGGAAHYVYDHLCLRDAIRQNFDLIYEAGYGSSAFAIRYFKKRTKTPLIVTNMDGMEWKRQKWNPAVQYITKQAEKTAVKHSDFLIADNPGIEDYFKKTYNVNPIYLPYGAEVVDDFNPEILQKYSLRAKDYYLVIARLEPENNIETIIDGFVQSESSMPLIIVGGLGTKYAEKLKAIAKNHSNIKFLGGIYDTGGVNSLRHFSKAYFHGHSVGGTNPSLLEAMACGSFIIAHNNEFNQSVLEGNGMFFSNSTDLAQIIINLDKTLSHKEMAFKMNNKELIQTKYNWDLIVNAHEEFFTTLVLSAAPAK